MADITIQSLPQANYQQPRDVIAIQRVVAGVPTDFQTDFATLGGDVRVFIHTWDISLGTVENIVTPTAGQAAIFLSGAVIYEPAPVPAIGPGSIEIQQGSTLPGIISMTFGPDAGAQPFNDTDFQNETGQVMFLNAGSGPGYNGTATAIIQYLLLTL